MIGATSELLARLRQHRLPGLDLGAGFNYPLYDDQSILNIPPSLCHFLNIPEMEQNAVAGALCPQIMQPLGNGYQRVILVLMDALAWHRLERWMDDGCAPVWRLLAQDGLLSPLASIVPSTTSAALTSLWTGRSAAEHGLVGYEMWMKEYGVVANTILHSPITFQNDVGSLERAGFKPKEFLTVSTLGAHLRAQGVKPYALLHKSIAHSGLSRMLFNETDLRAFHTAADLWINLRHLLEANLGKRLYAWVYWSEVDHFGHLYGPDDERTAAEFSGFSLAMERLFLPQLSPVARRNTLLILTADHGQITTPVDSRYELRNHPHLMRSLHIYPTGENRLAYLHVRPGQAEAVREYIERAWPGQFTVLDSGHALEAGLFGPGVPHPFVLDRLGEMIVVPHDNAYLWWANKDNPLAGRHGGLHPQEMLVPFLAAPLS
ncbi:MAG: alkaline phosphatase family protein [Anaerolineales bacterium]|nr:alkaline phosphatase family protein [Anaerolineales bacterium]